MSGIIGSYFNTRGSGVVAKLGTDGQVFTSAGAGLAQGFEAAPGGGKIGQVLSVEKTDTFSMSSDTFATITGVTVAITPAATSSKILVLAQTGGGGNNLYNLNVRMIRDSTVINLGDAAGSRARCFQHGHPINTNSAFAFHGSYLDSPSSTSELTYALQVNMQSGGTITVNYTPADTDAAPFYRGCTTLTVMEVLA